jgi:hypothetical protein
MSVTCQCHRAGSYHRGCSGVTLPPLAVEVRGGHAEPGLRPRMLLRRRGTQCALLEPGIHNIPRLSRPAGKSRNEVLQSPSPNRRMDRVPDLGSDAQPDPRPRCRPGGSLPGTADLVNRRPWRVMRNPLAGGNSTTRLQDGIAVAWPGVLWSSRLLSVCIDVGVLIGVSGEATARPVGMKEVLTPFFMTGRTVAFSAYDRPVG